MFMCVLCPPGWSWDPGSHPESVAMLLCDIRQVLRPQFLPSAARIFPNTKFCELCDSSWLVHAPWTHAERECENVSSQTPASLIKQLLADDNALGTQALNGF